MHNQNITLSKVVLPSPTMRNHVAEENCWVIAMLRENCGVIALFRINSKPKITQTLTLNSNLNPKKYANPKTLTH